nr:MAG TPA: hypothetical protein [Caudoviricetes sp.]
MKNYQRRKNILSRSYSMKTERRRNLQIFITSSSQRYTTE